MRYKCELFYWVRHGMSKLELDNIDCTTVLWMLYSYVVLLLLVGLFLVRPLVLVLVNTSSGDLLLLFGNLRSELVS